MAKKENDENVNNGEHQMSEGTRTIIAVAGAAIIAFVIHRAGYNAGVDLSKKVLKRHDKDVRRMKREAAKREKNLRKDLKPEKERKWPWSR